MKNILSGIDYLYLSVCGIKIIELFITTLNLEITHYYFWNTVVYKIFTRVTNGVRKNACTQYYAGNLIKMFAITQGGHKKNSPGHINPIYIPGDSK